MISLPSLVCPPLRDDYFVFITLEPYFVPFSPTTISPNLKYQIFLTKNLQVSFIYVLDFGFSLLRSSPYPSESFYFKIGMLTFSRDVYFCISVDFHDYTRGSLVGLPSLKISRACFSSSLLGYCFLYCTGYR